MCGRYNIVPEGEAWQVAFETLVDESSGDAGAPPLQKIAVDEQSVSLQDRSPRFNVAPAQQVPVIRHVAGEGLVVSDMKWGLVPSWAKDPAIGNRMINARSETCHEKPSFRTAVRRQRCLLPATGWYEWQARKQGKQPFHIYSPTRRHILFAGLWSAWQGGDEVLETCTILTRPAAERLRPLHERMPVVFTGKAAARWIASRELSADELAPLFHDVDENFAFHPVSTFVNRPSNEGPRCLQPEA